LHDRGLPKVEVEKQEQIVLATEIEVGLARLAHDVAQADDPGPEFSAGYTNWNPL
jgi:hypothetical protein